MCVCLRLLVDWYCGFSAVAAWYGHVMLDWRERDRARCTLGRPASSDYATRSDFMLIGSLPLLLPSSSSPKLSLLLSTFVFASLLYFWFASSSECTPMWPVKINTIDQTKLPNCWQVSRWQAFFLASSGHVRWTSAALWWWKHATSRRCFTAIHHFFI